MIIDQLDLHSTCTYWPLWICNPEIQDIKFGQCPLDCEHKSLKCKLKKMNKVQHPKESNPRPPDSETGVQQMLPSLKCFHQQLILHNETGGRIAQRKRSHYATSRPGLNLSSLDYE